MAGVKGMKRGVRKARVSKGGKRIKDMNAEERKQYMAYVRSFRKKK